MAVLPKAFCSSDVIRDLLGKSSTHLSESLDSDHTCYGCNTHPLMCAGLTVAWLVQARVA